MKSRIGLFMVGIVIMAVLVLQASGKFQFRYLNEMEYLAYDARLRLSMPGGVDPRVVIIDVDERSLATQGRWPWPRDKLANLVDILFNEYGVEILGFDIVFPEPDEDGVLRQFQQQLANGEEISEELKSLLEHPSRDEIFANTLAQHNVVLGYSFDHNSQPQSVGVLPEPLFDSIKLAIQTNAPQAGRYTANLPQLQSVAHSGFFSLLENIDSDGTYRRVSLLNKYGGNLYESFSLSVARNYLGMGVEAVVQGSDLEYAGLEALDLGFSNIAVDGDAAVYVPYRGRQGSFRYISATDILEQTVESPEDLEGIIVLVGTSATGLVDLRPTPVQNVFPGVEIHANVIAGLLDGTFKSQPEWVRGAEVLLLLITGLVLTFLLPWLSAMWMTLLTIGISLILAAINIYFWNKSNLVLPLANSILLVVSIYLSNMVNGFFSESRSRRQLKQSFGLYVPPEIVEEMHDSVAGFTMGSEKREMTVLFSDIRDFTKISESLDPQELSELMNAFLTPMTRIVHQHRGAIDKYMGDALMAFWGAPLHDTDHARHAVEAALEMSKMAEELRAQFVERGWPEIRVGVGLSTGAMSVGNMGSEFRMAYTVLGDAVNLGARLEGLTKMPGYPGIIVSEVTANAIPGHAFRELDQVQVVGKSEPIGIFEPLGEKEHLTEQQQKNLVLLNRALQHYRHQQWDEAMTVFRELESLDDDELYRVYMQRIDHFLVNPPGDDWDGTFVHQTK
jgi:adenylate cyclase